MWYKANKANVEARAEEAVAAARAAAAAAAAVAAALAAPAPAPAPAPEPDAAPVPGPEAAGDEVEVMGELTWYERDQKKREEAIELSSDSESE